MHVGQVQRGIPISLKCCQDYVLHRRRTPQCVHSRACPKGLHSSFPGSFCKCQIPHVSCQRVPSSYKAGTHQHAAASAGWCTFCAGRWPAVANPSRWWRRRPRPSNSQSGRIRSWCLCMDRLKAHTGPSPKQPAEAAPRGRPRKQAAAPLLQSSARIYRPSFAKTSPNALVFND